MGLAGVHLIVVSIWVGLVLAELLLEGFAVRGRFVAEIATVHYWIDTLFEIPLLLAILVTGTILGSRLPELDGLHAAKVICGLVAVTATGVAVRVVRRRRLHLDDPEAVARCHRQLTGLLVVALPTGTAAGVIGLTFAF